jgi:mannosyltransferase OCH1-like enzyme
MKNNSDNLSTYDKEKEVLNLYNEYKTNPINYNILKNYDELQDDEKIYKNESNNQDEFSNLLNNIIIPLNIYQTWKKKDLPPKMKESVDKLKKYNPEFNHYLYDDDDCRQFIKDNFSTIVLETYDSLIPGAYKADFWRYCVLYIKGGIYLDIKYCTVPPFKLISMVNKEYFVKDISQNGGGIYNAFMICKKGNIKLKKCIEMVIDNVKNKFYGKSSFDPTGPLLMKKAFTKEELDNLNMYLSEGKNCPDKTCIYFNNVAILSIYMEYRNSSEQGSINNQNYHQLWHDQQIYK